MSDKPILFSAPMVRAILTGTKSQTRRIVKPQPEGVSTFEGDTLPYWHVGGFRTHHLADNPLVCPYGEPGDRLWVKETHAVSRVGDVIYRADYRGIGNPSPCDLYHTSPAPAKWKPSIFMFRKHSRITLEITAVRIERLLDISEADAIAEGIETRLAGDITMYRDYSGPGEVFGANPVISYRSLWESINGPDSWAKSPFVWVVSFSPTKETPRS